MNINLNSKPISAVFQCIAFMTAICILREGIEHIALLFVNPSKMVTMCAMIIITALLIVIMVVMKIKLPLFPEKFGKGYIILIAVSAALLISAPSNYIGGIIAILELFYGSIVTPAFEELIFRGYIWDRLSRTFKSETSVFITDTILFSLWHLGYMIPNIIAGDMAAVAMKMAAGFGYGLILGFIRLKTKNCLPSFLAHGILNLFMI